MKPKNPFSAKGRGHIWEAVWKVIVGGHVEVKDHARCMFVQVGFSRKDLWIEC
jgi:hypothetical protein